MTRHDDAVPAGGGSQTAGWLQDTDGDSDAALKGVQDDLDRGAPGWDNTRPAPPPTYCTLPHGKPIPY